MRLLRAKPRETVQNSQRNSAMSRQESKLKLINKAEGQAIQMTGLSLKNVKAIYIPKQKNEIGQSGEKGL